MLEEEIRDEIGKVIESPEGIRTYFYTELRELVVETPDGPMSAYCIIKSAQEELGWITGYLSEKKSAKEKAHGTDPR